MTIRSRRALPVLAVRGLVERDREWRWEELAALPGRIGDLGEVVEGFVGEAVPLRVLLEGSQPLEGAAFVTAESDDGLYRACIPREELVSKGWLAFAEDGQPLRRERGGPLRLVVPQGRTLCWNVKAVAELRLTAEGEPDSVPKDPDH